MLRGLQRAGAGPGASLRELALVRRDRGAATAATLERELMAGDIRGIVVIPADFSRAPADRRQGAAVQVIIDGADAQHRRLRADLRARACAPAGRRASSWWAARAPPIELEPRLLVQPRADEPLLPGARLDRHRHDA